ncbi:MAG TPA: hypothetical protein PLK99_06540 [Burkholderiales bacterium]|nr:hypothetical protein [Burkholderiales bacterium]
MAIETTTWDSLQLLRSHGQKPALPVIVTTKPDLPRKLWGVGCMVIVHKAGDVFPVKLLDGLDVILMLDRCELGSSIFQLAASKGVKFAKLQAWCRCGDHLTAAPILCESYDACSEWLETHAA